MQSGGWAPEHCAALRDYLARGMSYSKIAEALNARFGTAYTRNATIGRGKRMGLVVPDHQKDRPKQMRKAKARRLKKLRQRRAAESSRPEPVLTPTEPPKLRCVGIAPTPAFADRARTGRLPLSLWRRQERRGDRLLRPSAPRGLKLLHAAF
jgi:GcrA cell cycle regulator